MFNPELVLLLLFCLGLILGSFFNVCIYRIPLEQEIVFTPSHCVHCEKPIPWKYNIPLLGYLILRGKCFNCRKKISIEYPLVEFSTGLLFCLLYLRFGMTWHLLSFGIFSSLLLIISVIDLHHRIIPDELSLSGAALGFLASLILGPTSWMSSLIGIVLGGGIFFVIGLLYEKLTGREGLGGGDVKLLGMMGAWLGYQSILPIIIISSALGSFIGIFLMVKQKGNMKTAIPFGPFLAVAAMVCLFWGDLILAFLFPPLSGL